MNYNYVSHGHCYTEENPPCGFTGKHCCLCDILTAKPQPVSQEVCGRYYERTTKATATQDSTDVLGPCTNAEPCSSHGKPQDVCGEVDFTNQFDSSTIYKCDNPLPCKDHKDHPAEALEDKEGNGWEREFREHFEHVYFGKDDDGHPQYAPEAVIDEAVTLITTLLAQVAEESREKGERSALEWVRDVVMSNKYWFNDEKMTVLVDRIANIKQNAKE